MADSMDAKVISLNAFRAAKKARDPDRLAHAIMARAEAAGQSVTDWLADGEHRAECVAVTKQDEDCICEK